MNYYAVAVGKTPGVYKTWDECKKNVFGFKNSIYKKYKTMNDALRFIEINTNKKSWNDIIKTPANSGGSVSKNVSDGDSSNDDTDDNVDYYVYTDGACSNNGYANAMAGYGIYFGINDQRNVSCRIKGKQTNNVAELTAIIETYYIIKNDLTQGKKIVIVTDSKYSILCLTNYGDKIYNNILKTSPPNKDLILQAYNLYKHTDVRFKHIYAHTHKKGRHYDGNKHADKLAVLGALKEKQ
jgi:ribonuclease HI